MKTKYMLNGGLAFTEKHDIKKLERLAAKGWLLKGFAWGGFMYKLVKGPKQKLAYTIDYQSNTDDDYLGIFAAAGWQHVTSWSQQIHIFSAPQGTAPIYSYDEVAEGKYRDIMAYLGRWFLYSLLALVICYLGMKLSLEYFDWLFYPLAALSFVGLVGCIFCGLPYIVYKFKTQWNR